MRHDLSPWGHFFVGQQASAITAPERQFSRARDTSRLDRLDQGDSLGLSCTSRLIPRRATKTRARPRSPQRTPRCGAKRSHQPRSLRFQKRFPEQPPIVSARTNERTHAQLSTLTTTSGRVGGRDSTLRLATRHLSQKYWLMSQKRGELCTPTQLLQLHMQVKQ